MNVARRVLKNIRAAIAATFALGFAMAVATSACGTDAVGVDACRQIESARCKKAPNCDTIAVEQPPHRDAPASDVDACIRFYHDACLHGLSVTAEPGAAAVKACVDALNSTNDCDVIAHPEHAAACGWLVPPQPAPAATDAAADGADATTD